MSQNQNNKDLGSETVLPQAAEHAQRQSQSATDHSHVRTHNAFQSCCHCGEMVNLDLEGAQYPNGEAAHEHCHDSRQFELANASDFRD